MKQTAAKKPTVKERVDTLLARHENLSCKVAGIDLAQRENRYAADKIEQLEATRVTYDDLAAEVHKLKAQIEKRATYEDLIVISGSIDKSLAARVLYDAPVLAVRRRASRWSWLFGGSRHTEVVVELRKVTLQ